MGTPRSRPAAASGISGRRLAAALALSALALVISLGLWLGSAFRVANECRETGYEIADSVEMTDAGCRVIVDGKDGLQRSKPLPDQDAGPTLVAIGIAALSAVPPFFLVVTLRRGR